MLEFLLSDLFTIMSLQCGINFAKQPTVCLFIPSFYQRKYPKKLLRLYYAITHFGICFLKSNNADNMNYVLIVSSTQLKRTVQWRP